MDGAEHTAMFNLQLIATLLNMIDCGKTSVYLGYLMLSSDLFGEKPTVKNSY